MSEDSPSLEEVANALPQRPIDAREISRLVLADEDELLFNPSSTVRVEGGIRVATAAVQFIPSGHRYFVGWSADDGQWVGINQWPPDEFQAFELEYDIDDWPGLLTSG